MGLVLARASMLLLALAAGGCQGRPEPPASVSLTQGAGLLPTDAIDGLDAVVATDGAIRVVWRERLGDDGPGRRRARLVSRRGSGTPLRWGPRVVIDAVAGDLDHPALVASPDGVHLFAGAQLHHWWWPTGAAAPRDLGTLLSEGGPRAAGMDAAAARDGVLVVFSAPGRDRRVDLLAIRWEPGRIDAPVRIATLEDFRGVAPRLLGNGSRWTAYWADNALVQYRDPRINATAVRIEAGVHSALSTDGGAHWTAPATAAPAPSGVAALAAGEVAGSPTVFIAADGLFEYRLAQHAPPPPTRIAAYRPGFLSGSADTTAVAFARCDDHDALAWVDARHRRSDRRPWNPLGGFPWGDDPDWDNNDLFLAKRLPTQATAAATLVPLRLTADGSMTSGIAMVARDGRLLVFRSGRARVRKAPGDAGAPPQVTGTPVPCSAVSLVGVNDHGR